MPDTLLLLATETLDAATLDAADARADLTDAMQDVAAARAEIERLGAQLAELNEIGAGLRKDLAATEDHAEGEKLLEQLDQNRRAQHHTQAELLARRQEHETARAAAGRAAAELARAQARIDAAPAAIKAAEEAAARRTRWLAIANNLAATLVADANALLGGPIWTAARDRIFVEFPAALHTAAHDGAAAVYQELADLAAAAGGAEEDLHDLHEAHDTTGGSPGDVETRRIELARAERELAELVTHAAADLAAARAALEKVAADPALSPAVKQRISELTTDGGAAVSQLAAKRQARDEALAEVVRLHTVLADLQARAADGEAGLDTQIADATTALAAAETAYTAAKTAYEQVLATADAWIASVPDLAWKRFAAFEDATHTLNRLIGTSPATLGSNMVAAEKNLANALAAAHADADNIQTAAEAVEEARRALATVEETRAARLLAAVRGDK